MGRIQSFKEVIGLENPGSTVGQLTQKLCSMIIMPYSLELLAECGKIIRIIEDEPKQGAKYSCIIEETLSTLHNEKQENQTNEKQKENGVEQESVGTSIGI